MNEKCKILLIIHSVLISIPLIFESQVHFYVLLAPVKYIVEMEVG